MGVGEGTYRYYLRNYCKFCDLGRMRAFFGVILFIVCCGNNGVRSWQFNCDPVNQAQFCLCTKGDNGGASWDIACPAKLLEVYPLTLKIMISSYDQEEATLRILCDPNMNEFRWRMVQGLDFSHDNITFDVTSLEISYCPLIPTEELKDFFLQIKLDPEDLMMFSYQSWRSNTRLPSDFLSFMPNLELIDLRNNQLDFLPNTTGLEYLTHLNLRGNRIASIPKDAFKTNKNLQEIQLAGNRLGKIEMHAFPTSLRLLDLMNNQITSLSNESLENLLHLEKLFLNNNPLQRVESGAFNELKNLTELAMDSSKLFTLPVLKNLPKLTNLSISYSLFTSTKLVTTTESSFYGGGMTTEVESTTDNPNFYSTTSRDEIIFEDGTSTEPPKYFQRARHSILDDDGDEEDDTDGSKEPNENSQNYNHQAEKDPGDEELIGDLMALKKLVLINDDLKTLSWLGYLPNLTDLILSRNEIKLIPQGFFSNLPSVVHVDMSKNAIADLSDLNAPHLAFLDLSNNFIRYLDRPHLSSLRKLRVLSMASNKIEYIHPKAFENLRELMILDLSNNHISFNQGPPIVSRSGMGNGNNYGFYGTGSGYGATGGSSKEDESLQESPLQYCEKLERVNLRNNLITKIWTDWTFALPWLSILDVSHNKIRSIHPRDLYFVARNVRVDLRYNEITDVDMDFAEVLLESTETRHVAVMLDGNPIHCDCHALAFKKFSMSSYLLQYTDLRCHTPPYLHGSKFRDLSENDLTCTIEENCPKGCNCIELPSENLIKINCYSAEHILELGQSLRNFTEDHDPYEFEVSLAGKGLRFLNESLIREISQQVRYVNLTGNKLTSLEFLDVVAEVNNVTKFALANNPFRCDGCKFQQIWWRHYQRISDIRSVTCVPGDDRGGEKKGVWGGGDGKVLSFYELVKDTVCVEELISSEVRLLIILLGIFTPLVILAIACCTKQQKKERKELIGRSISNGSSSRVGGGGGSRNKSRAADLAAKSRTFKPPRSKVVELDHSKF